MAFALPHSVLLLKPSICSHRGALAFSVHLSSFTTALAALFSDKGGAETNSRQPTAASLLEIAKDEIVKDDPMNNVPDWIFSKLGMQVRRRDQHPIGVLKDVIFDYFDAGIGTDAAGYLKKCLDGFARNLFGGVQMRWIGTYFPFTDPSFESEIYFQDKWLEVLGCGVMEQEVLKRSCRTDNVAWSFALGLERLAMVLFDIPDIRFNENSESQFLPRVATPPQESAPNVQELPIADTIFRDAKKLGSYRRGDSTFYTLIEYHAKSGDFKSLEIVFQRMKREKRIFVEKNFILVFRAYGEARLPHKAVELFNRMVDEFQCRQTVRSFNSVLNVIIQHGLYHYALEFYDYVTNSKKNISQNVLTLNLVIKAQCKLGLVSRAIDLFREMSILKLQPDAFTYCTLMDGLCKENKIDDAVALLDEMQIEGCYPVTTAYNVLINGLCKKGDLARAGKLVDNMFLKGCIPNEVTYNTLIHGLCLKGKLDKAISLLTRMLLNKLVPNDVTYGAIINGLVKHGRATDAVHVLLSMDQRGYKGNEYAYSALISGLFKESKSEAALKLWNEMIEKGCKPNTVVYSALIDGLCREGKPYEAEQILSQMINVGCVPNAFTYSSLMRGFFQVENSDKAILVWKEMAEKDHMDNEICNSVLIDGLCKNGKLTDALMVWKHMLTKGLTRDVVAYSSMIQGLCNAGSIKQGLDLFNEMLCTPSISNPDVITYNILINALCRHGSISQAVDLLNSMLNQGCDPDSVTCKIFLTTLRDRRDPPQDGQEFLDELVVRLLKRQRIVGASKIIEVMLQSFLHPRASTWESVVQQMCKPKRIRAVVDKCWGDLFR